MKPNITAVVAAWLAVGASSAFGQAYISFYSGAKGSVYDEFTTPGTDVYASGNVDVAFVWAPVGTADPLGAGIPITGVNNGTAGAGSTGLISQMLGSGWTEGYKYNGGSPVEVVTAVESPGIFFYNDEDTFQLNGATPGAELEVVTVGWDNMGGTVNTLSAALTDGGALGWSSSAIDQTGAFYADPNGWSYGDGINKFGVAPVLGDAIPAPEPTTLALGGLGGLSMLMLRRRKA